MNTKQRQGNRKRTEARIQKNDELTNCQIGEDEMIGKKGKKATKRRWGGAK